MMVRSQAPPSWARLFVGWSGWAHQPFSHSVIQSLPFYIGVFKGTNTQSEGLEDLGDYCNVKMRSRAGLVLSPACECRQPLAPREIGKPRDLKGDLASSEGGLRDSDDGQHLLELCFNKIPPPLLCGGEDTSRALYNTTCPTSRHKGARECLGTRHVSPRPVSP